MADEASLPDPAVATEALLEEQGPLDAKVLEALRDLLDRHDPASRAFNEEMAALRNAHGDEVFAELLFALSHLRFDPADAALRWQRILTHRESMQVRLGSPVDLRVALLSYFLDVSCRFKNPKIIEMRLFEQTQATAFVDELTGLRNYRLFKEHLALELQRSRRYGAPLCLVMIDVDHFKFYNDRNGHVAANDALVAFAELLRSSLRSVDLPARFGGEEFAIILPATPKVGANLVAERIRSLVATHPFPHGEHQPGGRLTISLGVATYPADARDPRELVRRADRAMYVAKHRGRNQVHLYGACRRTYRRLRAREGGTFQVASGESQRLRMLNLSEGGGLFLAAQPLSMGALIEIRMELPDAGHPLEASCRVVRQTERPDRQFETAVRFVEVSPAGRDLLTAFIESASPDAEYPEPDDDLDP